MTKMISAMCAAVGVGLVLTATTSPASAAKSARVSYATPAANTVVATVTSQQSTDQSCYLDFYGPRSYKTPRHTIEPYSAITMKVTGLPAGRYSAYLKCTALQVSKDWITVSGGSVNSPQTTLGAAPPQTSMSSSFSGLFGSS